MFRLRFFGSFAGQRRAFLDSKEIAPVEFHPAVEKQFDALATDATKRPPAIETRWQLFRYAIKPMLPLIIRSALWNTLSALTVLAGVIASREVLKSSGSLSYAAVLCALFFVAKLAQTAVDAFDIRRRAQIHRGLQMYLFRMVNQKICLAEPASSGEFTTGQLKTLVASDVESVEDFLGAAINQWVPATLMIAVLGTALWWLVGWMGTLALLLALTSLPFGAYGGRLIERFQNRAQGKQDALTTVVGEWVKNIRLVRFLGWERAFESQIAGQMAAYCREFALRHTVSLIVHGIAWSWWMVPVLGMFAASVLTGERFGLEALFSTLWILNHLMNYVQMVPYTLSLYGTACAGAARIIRFLKAPELSRAFLPPLDENKKERGRPVSITLKELTKSYSDTEVLSRLSVQFDLGKRTAIVGSVASGKSTLLRLLTGEEIPTAGVIEIRFEDGSCGSLWHEDLYHSFRSNVASSWQQPYISNTSLGHNIDLGGRASNEEIMQAAVKAQLEPDIALLPLGLNQEIGETGINLSGGQKQRVGLARAFLSKRRLLILDDPLSAVDSSTESALSKELIEASDGIIMSSHRLGELLKFDRVLVLDRGKIVEDGHPLKLSEDPSSRFFAFLRAHD